MCSMWQSEYLLVDVLRVLWCFCKAMPKNTIITSYFAWPPTPVSTLASSCVIFPQNSGWHLLMAPYLYVPYTRSNYQLWSMRISVPISGELIMFKGVLSPKIWKLSRKFVNNSVGQHQQCHNTQHHHYPHYYQLKIFNNNLGIHFSLLFLVLVLDNWHLYKKKVGKRGKSCLLGLAEEVWW